MLKSLPVFLGLMLCCSGCDFAERQQKAEEVRREAVLEELKKTGKELHNQNQEREGKQEQQDTSEKN